MRNRVERLRIWLLSSAGFLLLIIVAFLGSARYLGRHRFTLPARLGLNIVRETDGYTVSQWDDKKKRTLFTIHAAKAVEHTDSKITLHDVSITLYGENEDRNDHIYGDEFEYDQKAEVFRAVGLVNLDLQAAQQEGGKGSIGKASQTLHVTTSKLVYLRKLGVAATSEQIEFRSGSITGHAMGADYNSDTGVLVMHSSVSMSGMEGKRPVDVTAATAEIDNHNHEIFMTGARGISLGQTVEAQRAILHTRPDGTLTQVEAQGNVTREIKGSRLITQHLNIVLNAKGQPQSAVLTGNVRYSSVEPQLQRNGQAEEASIAFDAQGQARQAVFTGAVHMSERTRATEDVREPWSSRDLTAALVKTALIPSASGSTQVREVEASGSAHLTAENHGTLARPKDQGREEMSADSLMAHMKSGSGGKQPPQLDTVSGRGHTLLHQLTVDGIDQTSSGDTLDAKFHAQSLSSGVYRRQASLFVSDDLSDMLQSVVIQGHVTMFRRTPAKAVVKTETTLGRNGILQTADVEQAKADRAEYDGDQDHIILTGSVQMIAKGSVLWAKQIDLDHKTGDVRALGSIKMDYVDTSQQKSTGHSGAPPEPTHILADRAEMDHATDVATFHGKPVRLWQGASQVQAPEIELALAQKRLIARGEASTGWSSTQQIAQVFTVIVSAGSDDTGSGVEQSGLAAQGCANTHTNSGKGNVGAAATKVNIIRIASGGLVLSGFLNQADFTGGFRADSADGTLRANTVKVYLKQDGTARTPTLGGKAVMNAQSDTAVPSLTGRLQRIDAVGHVDIQQPRLRASGEKLEYTADDHVFLLSGDNKTPPQVTDARGTTKASVLRIQSSCDDTEGVSVEALSAFPGEPAHRVQTDTKISNDEKIEKGKR